MVLSTKSNVAGTLLPFLGTISNEFFVKFRPFEMTKFPFDTVAKNGNIIAKTATMSKKRSTLSKKSFNS